MLRRRGENRRRTRCVDSASQQAWRKVPRITFLGDRSMAEENEIFSMFRLLVEEARDARRARRDLSNVFMSLNLAGVAALGFVAEDTGHHLKPILLAWGIL